MDLRIGNRILGLRIKMQGVRDQGLGLGLKEL